MTMSGIVVVKVGAAVLTLGILGKLFSRGADRDVDVAALVNAGALVVDVRTPGEFSDGHIDGAVNIPVDRVVREIGGHVSDKSVQIIVYCLSGSRSAGAKRKLLSEGYTHVVNGGSLRAMRRALSK